jgi:NADH-quinone oxidoreductase subunit G
MGLMPELMPGYHASNTPGMNLPEMLAAADLNALWVVGANPLKNAALAAKNAFVVVQDMFLTETAQRADIVLPAANAYEKNGTVTNACGEVQKLTRAASTVGAKADLEIMGLIAKEMGAAAQMGAWLPETIYKEIQSTVKAYDIPLAMVKIGAQQSMPVNGGTGVSSRPDLVWSAQDGLFTSGTLGRYSATLNSVMERRNAQQAVTH